MTGHIYVLFSSDYELHFGENYLPEREVLIEPTEKLLEGCEDEGIPMTIFADVTSVWRYRSLGLVLDYPQLFEDQLRRAISSIHDVQLHLHPHWMTSKFDGRKWHMDESKFKLSDVGYGIRRTSNLQSAEELIMRGKVYLEELLQPVDASYQCVAFRAGGYGIQPEDKEYFKALLSAGFKIDSSIVPGKFYKSNVNQIDFRRVPSKGNYRLSYRYGLGREDNEGIFEIPIAAYKKSFFESAITLPWILNRIKNKLWMTRRKFRPRGSGIQADNLIKRLASLIFHPIFVLEMSGLLNVEEIVTGTNRFIERHLKTDSNLYFSVSCHPKDVFPLTIRAIREFWRRMARLYGPNIKAITFQEASNNLERKQDLLQCFND
jgi:hypothetical protein